MEQEVGEHGAMVAQQPLTALLTGARISGMIVPGAHQRVDELSRKNQITIPADVIREAGLKPGDDVRVRSVGPGRIELIKTAELIEEFAGRLDCGTYPPGYLDDVRAGWA